MTFFLLGVYRSGKGLISSLVAVTLVSLAPSQVPPGGGGGSGWTIDYQINGSRVITTPSGTNTYAWDNDPTQWRNAFNVIPMAGIISSPGASISGSSSGTVKVRVRWTGGGLAPNHVWLKVDSSAQWKGDSGDCSNGQNDSPVSLAPVSGAKSSGSHIIRKAYSGQPITFDVALTSEMACSTLGREYGLQVTITAAITDRSAALTRSDGGTATLDGDTYTGHTLLSWSGVHDGLDYDALPDGGPGLTSQTLTGTASGAWSTKSFTNPQTQQAYATSDLTINWGGSTTGSVSLTPPNPLTVLISTYQGNMPQFDPEGTTPKEETWTYKVKDNQDGASIDLKWKWIAHYAHENWVAIPPDPERPEEDAIVGSSIWTRTLSAENPNAYGSVQGGSMSVTTLYEGGTPSGIPGFAIEKHHIGISDIRSAFERTATKYFAAQNVELSYDDFYGAGIYSIKVVAKAPLQRGIVTAWNKKGQSGIGAMRFVSCDDYVLTLEQKAPGEGQ